MKTYVVVGGDWLAKIAQDHGSTVSAIWNHPENAGHRAKRKSPDVLYAGDVLRIPVDDEPPPSALPLPPSTPPPPPPGTSWPYERLPPLAPPRTQPSWLCPTGTCSCQPLPNEDPTNHRITLFDQHAARMPRARCLVYYGGRLLNDASPHADENGELTVELPPHARWLDVQWAPEDCPLEPPFPFRRQYFVDMGDQPEDGVARRLQNLGYDAFPNLGGNIAHLQRMYDQPRTGAVDDVTGMLFHFHDAASLAAPSPREETAGPLHRAGAVAPWPPTETPGAPTPEVSLLSDVSPPVEAPEGERTDRGVLLAGAAAPTPGPAPAPPFDPFLRATPPTYTPSDQLAALFADFPATFPGVCLSITEVSDPFRAYLGIRDRDVCFSASTCKATALVAATLLLGSLRWLAWAFFWDGVDVPPERFLDEAAARLREPILEAARAHPELATSPEEQLLPVLAGRRRHGRLPHLFPAFDVAPIAEPPPDWPLEVPWVPGPYHVNFSSSFMAAIGLMMERSDNFASAKIIQTTGFGYIHGALVHGGLFAANEGLWLAGDYTGVYSRRDIPCVNDRPTAQGATTLAFVQLLDMALHGHFGDPSFFRAQFERSRIRHTSWLLRNGPERRVRHGFFDELGKIGDGPVRGAPDVFSEIIGIRHLETGRRFLISYQNANVVQAVFSPLSDFILPRLEQFVAATTIAF